MPIRLAPIGELLEIKRVSADEKVKRHLENLGITIGQKVEIVSSEGGAVILRVKQGRVALDSNMASGIFVAL